MRYVDFDGFEFPREEIRRVMWPDPFSKYF